MEHVCKRILLLCMLLKMLVQPLSAQAAAAENHFQVDVGQIGQKTGTFDVDQRHNWYIRIGISEAMSGLASFGILQTLSPSITPEAGSVSVMLVPDTGERILLEMGKQYDLTAGGVFVENGVAERIGISLTQEGISLVSKYGSEPAELVVCYAARINTKAPMGTQILGSAQLRVTDKEGNRQFFLSDKAVAVCGGFHIALQDSSGDPLTGGRFMLAREAEERELSDPTVLKELLDTGDTTIPVVYKRFYTSEAMTGEKSDTAVTDANGQTMCYGLAYGTYYLVQTESGRDGLLPSKPMKVKINEVSHLTYADGWQDGKGNPADNTIMITNSLPAMPQTGGPGTIPYTASGTAVILCACLLLWYNRKKKVLI